MNTALIEAYNKFDWEFILRKDLGESGNLNEIKTKLDDIKNIFDLIIKNESLFNNITSYQTVFKNALKELLRNLDSVARSYTNVSERPSKISNVETHINTAIQKITPIMGYINFMSEKDDDVSLKKQEELNKKIKESNDQLKKINSLTEKLKKDIEISGTIAEKQEVDIYGKEFDTLAKENEDRAKKSQKYMFVSLSITLLIACYFIFGKEIYLKNDNKIIDLWNAFLQQNILLKIFIISAGGYLVAHFSRNYSAEMNMYYTNKHRQLALNSHQRVLDAVRKTETDNESETKNAVLELNHYNMIYSKNMKNIFIITLS